MIAKIIVYTFRTFDFKDELSDYIDFEFDKLKESFEEFKELYEKENPKYIVGIAHRREKRASSMFESQAVNKFGKRGTVSREGRDSYELGLPDVRVGNIGVNQKFTTSFCNWTMYKISQLIERDSCKLSFCHVKEGDVGDLKQYLKRLG